MKELDNPEIYGKYDPDNMRRHIRDFPELCFRAWQLASEFILPDNFDNINKIVILGMGGSAIGGDLVSSLVSNELKIPLVTYRSYQLPAYVDSQTLVIASSYSGNTEETLTTFTDSLKTGARHLVITTGGRLKTIAENNGVPVFHFDYKAQPRAALPFSLIPILIFLGKLGLVSDKSKDIVETITILKNLLKQINEGVPFKNNRAKKLAADLYCRLPVIYGAEITAEVAHRWKTQLNENGKSWAFHEVFPELNHNAVVGYQIPQEISAKITVVLLESNLLSEPVKKRFLLTGKLLEKAGVSYVSIKSFGISPLSQIMSLILTGDFVSYFLAILNKKDPTPVEAIDFLKSKLSLG